MPTDLRNRTPAQLRQLLASYIVSGTPLRLTVSEPRQSAPRRHDVVLLGIAQDEHKSADPYSQRGELLIARFDATPAMLAIHLRDLQELEPLALPPTDPRHPDYEPEPQVVAPIPVEAMAARQRRSANRHDQL